MKRIGFLFSGLFFLTCTAVKNDAVVATKKKNAAVADNKKGVVVAHKKKAEDKKKQLAEEAKKAAAAKKKAAILKKKDDAVVFDKSGAIVLDRIEAVVFGQEGSILITKTDVDRRGLEGNYRTLDDIILEQLLFQEAEKYRIVPSEDKIDSYLETVQRESGLSREELKMMFADAGYTYDDGRKQLGIMFANNTLIDFKIKSRLIVQEKDIVVYYEAHPLYLDASYQLKRAVIPFDTSLTKEQQSAKIEEKVKVGITVSWSKEFWVNKADVAQEKFFIFDMKPGSISRPEATDQGFELFILVAAKSRRLVSFEDRYKEISDILREPRFEQLFEEYKKELFDVSAIVRF